MSRNGTATATAPEADEQTGSTSAPGNITTACPRGRRPGTTPPPETPPQVCEIESATAACSHGDGIRVVSSLCDSNGRNAIRRGSNELGVVPDDRSYAGDMITLKAEMRGTKCERHPQWTITQASEKQEARGTLTTFRAKGWKLDQPWCPKARPRRYDVEGRACNGRPHRLSVLSYPADKVSVQLNLREFAPRFSSFLERIQGLFRSVLGEAFGQQGELVWLEGVGKWESQWAEFTDHRAFYKYAISLGFQPLLSADFKLPLKKLPLPVALPKPVPLPPWLVNCAFFLTLSGRWDVNLHFNRSTPDFADHTDCERPLSGQLRASVSAEMKAGHACLMVVCVEATTTIDLQCRGLIDERGFGVQGLQLRCNGVSVHVEMHMLWQAVNCARDVQVIAPKTVGTPSDRYYVNELLTNKMRGGSLARI